MVSKKRSEAKDEETSPEASCGPRVLPLQLESTAVPLGVPLAEPENELKWPPTFQEVFDKTHKKKRTNQYISDTSREVAEQVQIDPEVWVAASGAPKKDHVYGFWHNIYGHEQGVIWRLEFRLIGD
ncbi:hypothetical protein Taro_051256 [Colocasia esculenta]|uniref:Uncharacterized protein n=1 Tax=Colocasia esculenta TaxID=4460 RepID=A0A843XGK3_COLES|nr:hypothetical protein [Colocasia esculenta]